jgi:hypothetical protein
MACHRSLRALALTIVIMAGLRALAMAQIGTPTGTPTSAPSAAQPAAPAMDMSEMSYNANGVMPMYGMSKSGMHMDMSTTENSRVESRTRHRRSRYADPNAGRPRTL